MPWELQPDESLEHYSRLIAAGELTSAALVQRCLSRINARDGDVRAWVSVDRDGALAAAEQLDAELSSQGPRGPLHGIPVGIKDIIDVAGCATAAGFPPLAERIVVGDAEVVRRLRAAGAVVLGKTVTTQFACYDPPATRNPWNLDRTPGGSSSGSAAAVADGMCLAAIGTQTGGSITRPASFCGIAGCKPTFGRVSRRGVVPLAEHLDHVGPLARSVTDLAILLDAITGYDADDPFSIDSDSPGLYEVMRGSLPRPRLGAFRGDLFREADSDAQSAVDDALSNWAAEGAEVVDVAPPAGFDRLPEHHRRVMAVEAAAYHEQRFRAQSAEYLPGIRQLIEEGLAASPTDYARSLTHQAVCRRQMAQAFAGVDALVCPATLGAAPDCTTTGHPLLNIPWSYTGLPVVSFPLRTNGAGMPIAVQFVGRALDEAGLFRAAGWCESRRGGG